MAALKVLQEDNNYLKERVLNITESENKENENRFELLEERMESVSEQIKTCSETSKSLGTLVSSFLRAINDEKKFIRDALASITRKQLNDEVIFANKTESIIVKVERWVNETEELSETVSNITSNIQTVENAVLDQLKICCIQRGE